jgi:phenylalanyl-tRNA synthetase beta chain
MLVSWNWLADYVPLDMPVEDLTTRLTLAGLNLESVENVEDDTAIDLEVTSNRPDCLGHLGIAREVGVLYGREMTVPPARIETVRDRTADGTSVAIECPDLCPAYLARIVRGVRIGPSPEWMQRRLRAVGITPINNVVDVTNYVLMECGQPLHATGWRANASSSAVPGRARRSRRSTTRNTASRRRCA